MEANAEAAHLKRVSHWKLYILILLVVFAVVFVLSLNLGYAEIPFRNILIILFKQIPGIEGFVDSSIVPNYETVEVIIVQLRLPRVVNGALVGAALAAAGVTYQGIFRNPMASPYVIGASTGASVGSALVFVLGVGLSFFGVNTLQIFAFCGSLLTVLFVYTISRVGSKVPVTTLLLTGIAIGLLQNAVVTFLRTLASDKIFHGLTYWLIGSLVPTENWGDVFSILPFIVAGMIISYMYSRDLNIIALGEKQAQYLGVEIEKVKRILLISGTLMTAAAVSISGLIGFVGLIIPHLTRIIIGPDHRVLLPTSAILGATFLVICDAFSRVAMGSGEAPVGVITAFAGAPFFLYLLRRKKKGYAM